MPFCGLSGNDHGPDHRQLRARLGHPASGYIRPPRRAKDPEP
jgi:hypothetical protein